MGHGKNIALNVERGKTGFPFQGIVINIYVGNCSGDGILEREILMQNVHIKMCIKPVLTWV